MKRIKTINKIAEIGLNSLDEKLFSVGEDITEPDGIMVRSAPMHDMEFSPKLKAIVRCGAGVNNIPIDKCAEKGIVVFNTPGANANAVKELTIAALLLSSRKITDGINWVSNIKEDVIKQVEKGKSAFSGNEILGKTLGVIGLGAIGGLVANAAHSLGMNVIGLDKFMTVDAAWHISHSIKKAESYDEIYAKAHYITLHVPLTSQTRELINEKAISKMKDGVKIINLSRSELVNINDLKQGIKQGKVSCYITDFPTKETVNCEGIIATPHLGASTNESEENCAVMAANELRDFLLNGNIKNSVNYPDITMERTTNHRLLVLHKNIPNMLNLITSKISDEKINIENLANRSKGEYAVTMIDTAKPINPLTVNAITQTHNIVRVIIID